MNRREAVIGIAAAGAIAVLPAVEPQFFPAESHEIPSHRLAWFYAVRDGDWKKVRLKEIENGETFVHLTSKGGEVRQALDKPFKIITKAHEIDWGVMAVKSSTPNAGEIMEYVRAIAGR